MHNEHEVKRYEEDQKSGKVKGKGVKLDAGKLRMDLVPVRAFQAYVEILTFGVQKYGANNWRKVVGWRWRYMAAALRHCFSYLGGQRCDEETGKHHLAHALCCLNFVLDNDLAIEAGVMTVPDGDADPEAK